MENKRQLQVGETIKRQFSLLLQQEGSYVYGAEPFVTVTSVKMTPDLGLARVYLSVYNTENKQAVILEMEEAHHRLKQGLHYRLRKHLRKMPELEYYLDDTLDEMYRLNNLFDRLHDENQMGNEEG